MNLRDFAIVVITSTASTLSDAYSLNAYGKLAIFILVLMVGFLLLGRVPKLKP